MKLRTYRQCVLLLAYQTDRYTDKESQVVDLGQRILTPSIGRYAVGPAGSRSSSNSDLGT